MLEFSLTSVARRFLVFFALLSGIQGDCGAPPKLINAIPKVDIHGKSFPPGTTVIYKCLDNFYNIHAKSDVVTCLAESKWTNIEEFCERSCLDPPRVQFANMREEDKQSYYTAGTTVTYICRNTHSIIPGIDSVITCLDNYTWTAVPVFCKGKSCGDPGSPPNGKAIILTDLLYLARVNFTCDDGYTLIGSPSTRCLRKGDGVKWQNKPPVCERIIASTMTATFSSGQTKTDVISIGPTVKLSGDATTHIPATTALITPTAFASGQTEKDDKSLGDCNRPERIPHAELRSGELKDTYPVGTTLTYRCIPGYELIRGIIPRITCTGTSTWSPEAPEFCQGKRCAPPDLENGRVTTSTDYRLGAEITFTCDFGFRLIGRNSARCTLAGGVVAWDYQGPLCQRIPCFPPPEIDNGSSDYDGSRDYDYGQVATYTCQPSFTLIGSKNLVCTTKDGKNGEWDKPAPECKVVSCRRPEIANGNVLSPFQASYPYDHSLTLNCNEGYTLTGSNIIKCGADSQWKPSVPTCLFGTTITTTTTTTTTTTSSEGETPSGTTLSPVSDVPKDDSGSVNYIAISVGAVVGVLVLIAIVVIALKYRARHNEKGKINTSGPTKPYDVVPQNPDIALEEKSTQNV
ncbi:complement receptor type 1-like isoform X4 [Hemicordylus capensis]|uniref:complement receptor type 1-like isoform X4 n=1 Tax=Hemicordylus capensis TaxID=884348 RepID=UPI002302DF3B|nr:complement receptor type 1-like isoform X4 [Hemicordylus capensis]